MANVVLTRPQSAAAGVPGTIVTGVLIPFALGSNIVNVDSIPCENNVSVKWIYTLMNAAQDKVLTVEVLAAHRLGGPASHNRYSAVGDRSFFPHRIDVIVTGGNIVLEITNLSNGTSMIDYIANVVRIQTLI